MKKKAINLVNLISVIALVMLGTSLNAQPNNKSNYPVIGEFVPDFKLSDIQYFYKKTIDQTTVKGKHIILDFFSMG